MRNSKTIVAPVSGERSKLESGLYMLVQLENNLTEKERITIYEDEHWVIYSYIQIRSELIVRILCTYAGTIIDKFINSFELETEEEIQSHLLVFCGKICGERSQKFLSIAIEEYLASCINFEHACVLYFEQGKLFTIRYSRDEEDRPLAEGFTELPLKLGLTGKCLEERKTLISSNGRYDAHFISQVDNILKLKQLENIMMIPLFVDSRQGKVLGEKQDNSEFVGILHLMNYKLGDISKVDEVNHK